MRRADWIALLVAIGLGMGSLALIVSAFLTEGNSANLLMGLGISTTVGCMIWIGQQVTNVATRRPDITTGTHTERFSSGSDPSPSSAPSAQPAIASTDSPPAPGDVVRIFRAASATPSITDLIARAEREVLALVISGRNFFQPRLHDIILSTIRNPSKKTRFRLLALNHFSGSDFLEARANMMDMRRGLEFKPMYEKDFEQVREYSAQVTIEDPTRERFDVRFYNLLPTTYFYIIDDVLYLGGVLSKPIASSPMIVIKPASEEAIALIAAYRSHFEFYWSSSKFFITLIGLDDDGKTLLVRNRKRGWEWPTGYIEPNEDLPAGAAREFREETGYSVGRPVELASTSMGYYFVARIGTKVGSGSAREISDVTLVDSLPEQSEMSFHRDYRSFVGYLQQARSMFPSLSPPP